MTASEFRHVADVGEVSIGFQRPDGSTGSTPVWDVGVGGDVYVRSMNGPRGGWYRRLRDNPDGWVRENGHEHPVRAVPVEDEDILDQVTRAYESKYGGSPYLQPLLGQEAAHATLRLEPR
jgi:hypothetical protein